MGNYNDNAGDFVDGAIAVVFPVLRGFRGLV